MSDFLREYLERRRSDVNAQLEGEETSELLGSLNSNISLVANNTKTNESTSKKILGTLESQVIIQQQRDSVYSQFTKEQLGLFYDFSTSQKAQTKVLSKHLLDLSAEIRNALGKQLDVSNKALGKIANYLKPDTTHSKRDAARDVADRMGLRSKPKGDHERGQSRSIVDDISDLFDFDSDKEKKGKGKGKGRRGKGGRGAKGRLGRTLGNVERASELSGKASWWDKIKGVAGKGKGVAESGRGLFSKIAGSFKGSGGLLKGSSGLLRGGSVVAGKIAAPVGAAIDLGTGLSDLADGKRQSEMPSGWDLISPMRWGMWGGEKINQGYGSISKALGGTGSLGSDIYDGVDAVSNMGHSVKESIEKSFKNGIIPEFHNVVNNWGKFAEDFGASAKGLVSGLGDKLSNLGKSLSESASAAWEGTKRAVGSAVAYGGNMANSAVQTITGDKSATVGSVASSIKEKALSFVPGLGGTSAQFESGKAGTKAVGWDPTGGTSYGKYQIASKTGTSKEFLDFIKQRGGNDDIHKTLSEAGFANDTGSTKGAAVDAWKKLAGSQGTGERLSELEHKFIEQKKFMPAYNKAKELGFNTDDVGVQDAIWSASVQHGKVNKEILSKVAADPNFKNMSAEDQIKAIYKRRAEYTDGLKGVSKAAGRDRYAKEVEVALAKSADAKKKGIDGKPKDEKTVDVADSKKSTDTKTESDKKPVDVASNKKPVGAAPSKEVAKDTSKPENSSVTVSSSKQTTKVVTTEPDVRAKKSPQPMVDQSIPQEVKPVQVANADQIMPKIEMPKLDLAGLGGTKAPSAVPSLDSIPLQLTDMGLVLLNIGHL